MEQGKQRRLSKIFRKDGRCVMVPMDHGVTIGPIKGIENMQKTVDDLIAGGVDAVLLHRGLAKRVKVDGAALIVQLSGMSNRGPRRGNKVQVCSVREAVSLDAEGVSVHVNVGDPNEDQMLCQLGMVAEECDFYGMPLLAMMYPRGPEIADEHDVEAVAHASRIGAELGADIIKTNFTGSVDSFRSVVESCPVPVLIAGGAKMETPQDILQITEDSIKAGGAGLSIGRNVFQYGNPMLMVKALSAIVHDSVDVEKAMKILGEI